MIFLKLKRLRLGNFTGFAPLRCLLFLALTFILEACGGGSSGGPPPSPPAPTPDFSLAVSPTTISVPDGQSVPVSLSATASNGFSSPVTVQVTGLPTGVTVSPSPISLTPGTPLQISISAASGAPTTTANVTFTGSSGSLSHTAPLSVTNSIVVTSNTPPFRTRYVRTDAVIPYNMYINASWIVYNPPTKSLPVRHDDPFAIRGKRYPEIVCYRLRGDSSARRSLNLANRVVAGDAADDQLRAIWSSGE
jgi:hypothetical protein